MHIKTVNGARNLALLAAALAIGPGAALDAQETEASLSFVLASTLQIQASSSESISFPFLAGRGALIRGNNLKVSLGQSLTPVSIGAGVDATLTPIAFLQLSAGLAAGTGWDLGFVGGLGLNERDGDHGNRIVDDSLGGVVLRLRSGATLQFDFSEIIPGRWNHIVAKSANLVQRQSYSGAEDGESWMFEADAGENRNGWSYSGSHILAWMPPAKIDLVGLSLESWRTFYGEPGGAAWGDDLWSHRIGLFAEYAPSKAVKLISLLQFSTARNFIGGSGDFGFYQDRIIDSSDPRRVVFDRFALVINIDLTNKPSVGLAERIN